MIHLLIIQVLFHACVLAGAMILHRTAQTVKNRQTNKRADSDPLESDVSCHFAISAKIPPTMRRCATQIWFLTQFFFPPSSSPRQCEIWNLVRSSQVFPHRVASSSSSAADLHQLSDTLTDGELTSVFQAAICIIKSATHPPHAGSDFFFFLNRAFFFLSPFFIFLKSLPKLLSDYKKATLCEQRCLCLSRDAAARGR